MNKHCECSPGTSNTHFYNIIIATKTNTGKAENPICERYFYSCGFGSVVSLAIHGGGGRNIYRPLVQNYTRAAREMPPRGSKVKGTRASLCPNILIFVCALDRMRCSKGIFIKGLDSLCELRNSLCCYRRDSYTHSHT